MPTHEGVKFSKWLQDKQTTYLTTKSTDDHISHHEPLRRGKKHAPSIKIPAHPHDFFRSDAGRDSKGGSTGGDGAGTQQGSNHVFWKHFGQQLKTCISNKHKREPGCFSEKNTLHLQHGCVKFRRRAEAGRPFTARCPADLCRGVPVLSLQRSAAPPWSWYRPHGFGLAEVLSRRLCKSGCVSPVVRKELVRARSKQTSSVRIARAPLGRIRTRALAWMQKMSAGSVSAVLEDVRRFADWSQPAAVTEVAIHIPDSVVLRRDLSSSCAREAALHLFVWLLAK